MPISTDFKERVYPHLRQIADHYHTPFHIYDEAGIKQTGTRLKQAFSGIDGFREYFAVKALPNPAIMKIMQEMGFGFDCSSVAELILSRKLGAKGDEIMFTSNNTSPEEFIAAAEDGGCILNLDDISLIAKVPKMPETICFRYNPGERRTGNDIIGTPVEAKYGVSHEQIIEAYRLAKKAGAKRFGLHTMLASNELNYSYMVQTAQMLLALVEKISAELDIKFDFINIGGGLGIPYQPEQNELDLESMAREITAIFDLFKEKNDYCPALYMESGRFITGPHGILVTSVINKKEIYRDYVGVDACMNALMRPALYGSYHHIEVLGKETGATTKKVDVAGSLCENNDKFAIQRDLPICENGDLLIIQDTGAHGHAMGFNYNGKMRPQELLFDSEGNTALIRREERLSDYFATLEFAEDKLTL
ncbi:diaminopimelate decarboxylase [Desulfotalea psychrophila]|uniref:Diaminopimelate decarboxylase n=1 Tax=Desulfotalea psychrophila (strain LSv54 / DSM 12343) TaxID=177439 RepID=Q6AIZ1_DESPS|nr:diaminopimelate decarboxylase [Desulfotalea psychrophila]CAG37689.1 probable diaminopimelate decarboxylase [Desulfotalea psychrophila LSv54]